MCTHNYAPTDLTIYIISQHFDFVGFKKLVADLKKNKYIAGLRHFLPTLNVPASNCSGRLPSGWQEPIQK